MKCTAALAGVLALAMLLTGCKKPVDTAAATAETAESAATDETAATPNPVEALPASVTVGTVLPKTEAAGRSYIDETLFIGVVTSCNEVTKSYGDDYERTIKYIIE